MFRACRASGSDRHDLFFLLGDELGDLLFVFVQEVVGLFFAAVLVVLVDLLVFFKLLDFVDEVATEVAERDFRVLAELLGQLDILLAALFGERGNADPDGLAVGGRIESEVGVAARLFGAGVSWTLFIIGNNCFLYPEKAGSILRNKLRG